MADLNPQQRTALARYWSEIYGGAARKLSTADLFGNIRDRAASLGLASVGVGASVVSTLRGYASRMIGAAASFARSRDAEALTGRHIAEAPWARPLTEQNTAPIYHILFDHTIEREDGSTVVKPQTIVWSGVLPGTVGDVRDLVASEAALMAAEGGPADSGTPRGQSLGTDNIQILAV
jgi:hypothetical protein